MTAKMLRLTLRSNEAAGLACLLAIRNGASFAIEPIGGDHWWMRLKGEAFFLKNTISHICDLDEDDTFESEEQQILFP